MDQLSRIEAILESKIDGTSYDQPPQSRIEYLLLQLQTGGGSGGGGISTSDFNALKNRVSTLETQNKTLAQGITELEKVAITATIPETEA